MSLQIFSEFPEKTSVEVRGSKLQAPLDGLCRQFSLAELQAATSNFDEKIGHGNFGPVYKGHIDDGSLVVAVKRLSRSSTQGVEEFQTEVQLLCQLRHQNLVSLIGFCYEKDERILVYEHMTHRSLDCHLFRNADPVPWKRRLEICIGTARGLHYLHTGTKYAIFHRDVKSHNILLDEKWNAKVSDFGLSKIVFKPKALTKKGSGALGTSGYMAPEMYSNREHSDKLDVYSLGVVLLEVLCGREANDSKAVEAKIVPGIIKCIKNNSIHDMIDPFLKGKIAPECLIKFVEIAVSCIYRNPEKRPSMGEVEGDLELALDLQEKADSAMKADNPHAGYTYEDVSFRVSVEESETDSFGG